MNKSAEGRPNRYERRKHTEPRSSVEDRTWDNSSRSTR